jgi:hypothetical protein
MAGRYFYILHWIETSNQARHNFFLFTKIAQGDAPANDEVILCSFSIRREDRFLETT